MSTKITATFTDNPPTSRPFADFALGDVLFVLDTRAMGIKVSDQSIRFLTMPNGAPQQPSSFAYHVPRSKRYGVPTLVDIRVTR